MGVELEAGERTEEVPPAFTESGTVRKATPADRLQVAAAMAKAFYDDPVVIWMMPDASRRLRRLERGFALFLERVYLPYDETYTTEHVAGGAIWAPPGEWKMSVFAQLRLLPAMAGIWRREVPRVMRALNAMESNHPHEPHYYLPFIGVEPDWQGKGIGTALLQPVLERCDRERVPAYLEATSPRNRACYLRNGFEDVKQIKVGEDAPPLWAMWREPRG